MNFSPAFYLLVKFTRGASSTSATMQDVEDAAGYLGVDLPSGTREQHIALLQDEVSKQNGFLTKHRESDTVQDTQDYRRSAFIREIVAHKRP